MLEAVARKWGYETITAEDGEAAWEIMQQDEPPRLLLLDWEMPKLDGLALCQQIRQQESCDPPFIILLSARQDTHDIIAGLDSGANEYIAKPFNNAELQARLQVGQRMLDLQTRFREAEERLQLAANVFTHASDGIMITRADGSIIDVNEAFTLITGFSYEEAVGENPRILKSDHYGPMFYTNMWRELVENGKWSGEIWNHRKSGESFPAMLTISAMHDADGVTQHYIALFSDITEQKQHQQQLEHLANYDALTNLPNRLLLSDRLNRAMSQVKRRMQQLAVVYLDLDGFKAVNDTHGHEVGDQLLITVANRMKRAIRDVDTIARIGGDEFVAVLVDLEQANAHEPMSSRLLNAAAQPVYVNGIELHVTASLGVTFFPQAEEIDADQLMRQADQAMYLAKTSGKNRYQLFSATQEADLGDSNRS